MKHIGLLHITYYMNILVYYKVNNAERMVCWGGAAPADCCAMVASVDIKSKTVTLDNGKKKVVWG